MTNCISSLRVLGVLVLAACSAPIDPSISQELIPVQITVCSEQGRIDGRCGTRGDEPLPGVALTLKNFVGETFASGTTDAYGRTSFMSKLGDDTSLGFPQVILISGSDDNGQFICPGDPLINRDEGEIIVELPYSQQNCFPEKHRNNNKEAL